MLYTNVTEKDLQKVSSFDTEGIVDYATDPFTFIKGVVKHEDEIVAIGLGRYVNEFKICLNPKFSNLRKAAAINILFESGLKWAIDNSNETIAIVTQGGKHYIKFLEKHFGFERIDGVPLKRST